MSYQRHSSGKLADETEQAIAHELQREKELVEDPELPISSYNYSALRDRLKGSGIAVSLPTIISHNSASRPFPPQFSDACRLEKELDFNFH